MSGYSKGNKASTIHAVQSDVCYFVEVNREQARSFTDNMTEGTLADLLLEAVDEAQGAADAEGKASFIVVKINGGAL